MALSSVSYLGNGSNSLFSVTFPYLSKSHVKVYINGTEDTAFTWTTSSTITTSSVPANLAVVLIKRTTPTTPLVDFVDGSTLTEALLDLSTLQALYVTEESKDSLTGLLQVDLADNKHDATNKVIKNVANPVNPQDAVTKSYVDSTIPASVASASLSASNAATSASAAATSASLSASNAATSASAAATSASFTADGTGAVLRTTPSKLKDNVHVKDFGADLTGVADSSSAFQAAMNSLGEIGGTIDIGNGKYLISSTISIPSNVTLNGRWKNPELVGTSLVPAYQNAGSALRLGAGVTINMGIGSGIEDVLIYRSGMSFPVVSTSAYAGTALTATGSGVVVRNVMVIGFNKLFVSVNHQRHVLDRVYGDNNNGIEISGSPDVDKITNCHMWPFATDTLTYPNPNVLRTGIAYYLHDRADWAKLTNCFSYAYAVGFKLENVNSCTLLSCSADSNFPVTNASLIGFDLRGTSTDLQLIGCQAAAQGTGYRVWVSAGNSVRMSSCNAWSNSSHNTLVSGGDLTVNGGISRNSAYGLSIDNAVSRVFVNGMRMSAITTRPFLTNVATTKLFVSPNCDFGDLAEGALITDSNATVQSVASADPLNLPASGDTFNVTGTTGFGSLLRGYPGRQVTLVFSGIITVGHAIGSGANMKLNGNVNFTTAANSTLTLRHNGVQWYETGRST